MPFTLKVWFYLSLKYFLEVERTEVAKDRFSDVWKNIAKCLSGIVYEDALKFLEKLYIDYKYSFNNMNKVINYIKPYDINEVFAILKDRVIVKDWDVINTFSWQEKGYFNTCIYTDRRREGKAVIERLNGKTTTINLIHEYYEFYWASDSDKEKLLEYLRDARKAVIKVCFEDVPFKFIISVL